MRVALVFAFNQYALGCALINLMFQPQFWGWEAKKFRVTKVDNIKRTTTREKNACCSSKIKKDELA